MSARVWWIDPANLLLFIILPLFLLACFLGGPLMDQFGSFDFLTPGKIMLGAACLGFLILGSKVGSEAVRQRNWRAVSFDPRRFDQVLVGLLVLSIVAHLLLVGPLLVNPGLMIDVLTGEMGAVFVARGSMTRLVGITSLTNLSPLVLCMCSVRFVTRGSHIPWRKVGVLIGLLTPLILVHAFVGAERLVIVENAIAALLPLFSFWNRLSTVARFVPLFGAVAVAVLFAVGEYTRSWAFYRHQFDTFAEFVSLRFLAYVAVASNTGAGMIETMDPVGHPLLTARWLVRLPLVGGPSTYTDQYMRSFGNVEFNNPGGIFAPIVDFGASLGILYLFVFGLVIGLIYGCYIKRHAAAMLAFPIVFIGLADLTQIWYWGEPRFIPQLLFLMLVITLAVRRRVPQPPNALDGQFNSRGRVPRGT